MKDWIILKVVMICALAYFIFQFIYFLGFAVLFSYGAGSSKIETYQFKTNNKNLHEELESISTSSIKIKDSIEFNEWGSYDGVHVYKKLLSEIKIKKNSKEINIYMIVYSDVYSNDFYSVSNDDCGFRLISINGKYGDDFGWFSWEKYKEVKLFEESIIEPLSKKYERIESPR